MEMDPNDPLAPFVRFPRRTQPPATRPKPYRNIPKGLPLRERAVLFVLVHVAVPALIRLRSGRGPLGRYLRKKVPTGMALIPAGFPFHKRRARR